MNTDLEHWRKNQALSQPTSRSHASLPQTTRNVPEENDTERKVKTKLMSMWNNMKYGWTVKTRTNFSKDSPVWLLGKCYHCKGDRSQSYGDLASAEEEGIDAFKSDFVSRIWMTYRREFPILNGSSFTTDCGWGCMIRSGQMLLAQALVSHFLGREWRWIERDITDVKSHREDRNHQMIIKWFGDNASCNNPLSLHTLVSLGESAGKKAGDWYGPGSVAHLLRQAVELAKEKNDEFKQISVYVAQDCTVYIEDVLEQCIVQLSETESHWRSLVLLVPVRLGAEKMNPIYFPCVSALLTLEHCIGIIGGRPKHSLYFVGFQDDKLIHLDPHYCQQVVDVWEAPFPVNSFHCTSPRKMSVSRMDPSCCIGFYIKTRDDFDKFINNVQPYLLPPFEKADYPIFIFSRGSSKDAMGLHTPYSFPEEAAHRCGEGYETTDDELECEEFEIL